MNVIGPINTGAAAGGAGVATATGVSTHVVSGLLIGAYILYNGSPPAGTTDVTIATQGTTPAPPAYNLLVVTDAATDGWFYPRVNAHDTAAAAQSTVWELLPIHDIVSVTIAGANDDDTADVWLMIQE